ncbi:MAG: glycerate kinase type-2 family protein [Candidatus Acidiferrales bacterium]
MKELAKTIFRETLASLDVRGALEKRLARSDSLIYVGGNAFDLRTYREIVAIAYGKGSFAMAEAFGDILAPEFGFDGILVGPTLPNPNMRGWRTFVGGHPVPNEESFAAGKTILDRLRLCDERSLVFFLLSGGGSSIIESPLPMVSSGSISATLDEFRKFNAALTGCGAPIEEINIIRRHVSATKGGRLAAAAPRSPKLTFGISDVPLGEENSLGSGPTLPDASTLADAKRVIQQYGLQEKLPARIRDAFDRGMLPETLKEKDPAFAAAHFVLILSQRDLTHTAHRACESRGIPCVCDVQTDNWTLEKAADYLLGMLARQKLDCPGRRVAVVAGGEVSSPVIGKGTGGRNSAFVLTCVPRIAGQKVTVLSAGTDGIDGNSPAAGAVANGESLARAQTLGLDAFDFLQRSDAFRFFERLSDAITTGPTGINVRDLRVLIADPD